MKKPDAVEMLKQLRQGPYRARGGLVPMSQDLGISLRKLRSWLYGAYRPTYEGEKLVRRLWEAHGLDKEPESEVQP